MSTLKVDTIKSDTTSTVTVSDSLSIAGSSSLTGEINFTGNGHKYIDVATLNGGHSLSIRHQDGGSYETGLTLDANGAAKLFHNNIKTFETNSSGITVRGPEGGAGAAYIYADEGDDNADQWRIQALTDGAFSIQNYASGSWETSLYAVGDGKTALYFNDSTKIETSSYGVHLGDSVRLTLGGSTGTPDCHFYHDTTNTNIQNITGDLVIKSNSDGDKAIVVKNGAATELYYNNTKQFSTHTNGPYTESGVALRCGSSGPVSAELFTAQRNNGQVAYFDQSGSADHRTIACRNRRAAGTTYGMQMEFLTSDGSAIGY